jgi:hypothetical protein
MQTVIILSVAFSYIYAECHYAECRYAECSYAAYRGVLISIKQGTLAEGEGSVRLTTYCCEKVFFSSISKQLVS